MSERLSSLLREWIDTNALQNVRFYETDTPANDPKEDYSVKYEARFKPSRSEQAEVAIMLSANDFIGIGFETRTNVACRLSVRNMRQGYAAGFEPSEKSEQQLLAFLNLVRFGKIAILDRCWPLAGLGGTHAAVHAQDFPPKFAFGPYGWLRLIAGARSMFASQVLYYEAWS